MNRDELLQAVCGIGIGEHAPGAKMVEAHEGGDLVAHADIYWRRVIVHPSTVAAGDAVATASETVVVAAVQNICVDPARRGQGWGRALVHGILDEVASHALIDFAATFDTSGFFAHFGWEHPDGAMDPGFLIYPLRPAEIEWLPGRIEIVRW